MMSVYTFPASSLSISMYFEEICGYDKEAAAEEERALLQDFYGLTDEIYRGPTEEERTATLLMMCPPPAVNYAMPSFSPN